MYECKLAESTTLTDGTRVFSVDVDLTQQQSTLHHILYTSLHSKYTK